MAKSNDKKKKADRTAKGARSGRGKGGAAAQGRGRVPVGKGQGRGAKAGAAGRGRGGQQAKGDRRRLAEVEEPRTRSAEVENLRARLGEAEETLRAIRSGEVDALVVSGPEGDRIYTLQGADEPYRIIIEQMQEGAVTVAPDGTILYCNRRFADMLGLPLEQVIGQAFALFMVPADRRTIASVLKEGRGRFEGALQASERTRVPVQVTANPVGSATGQQVCVVVTDLTQRKREEEILRAERLARSILENTTEAIVVCDPQGNILRANEAARRLCGGDLVGERFASRFPIEPCADRCGREGCEDWFASGGLPPCVGEALKGQVVQGCEVVLQRREAFGAGAGGAGKMPAAQGAEGRTAARQSVLMFGAGPIYCEDHQILGAVVTLTDITERRRIEEEIRQNRERLRVTLSSIGDAVLACDVEGRVTFLNAVAASLTGWPADEAIGQPVTRLFKIINEETREPLGDLVARVFREKRAIAVANNTALIARDGREIPIEDSAAPILDAAGNITGAVLVFHDASAKRRAQEALRASEERYRLAVRATNDAIWDLDPATGIICWNETYAAAFGRPPESGRSWQWWIDHIHPEDRERAVAGLRAAIEGREDSWTSEYRFQRADGVWADLYDRAYIARDESGEALRVVGAMQDQTERKRAEVALRASQERARDQAAYLQAVLDSAPALIWIALDRECRHVSGNWAATEFSRVPEGTDMSKTGLSPEKLAHYRIFENGVELAAEEMPLQRVAATGEPLEDCAIEFQFADGTVRSLLGNVAPLFDSAGQPSGAVAAFIDVTDRKAAEEALRQRTEELNRYFDMDVDLICVMDGGHLLMVNPAWTTTLGYGVEELKGRHFRELVHPADLKKKEEALREVVDGQKAINFVNRNRCKDGNFRWIEWSAVPTGEGERVYAVGRDVTERRQSEERLRMVNEELARKSEEMEQILYTISHDLKSPLVTIQGFLSYLAGDTAAGRMDRVASHCQRIQNASSRMTRLIDHLLDFSRVGRMKNEPTIVNLSHLVDEVVASHVEQTAEKKIQVTIQRDMPIITADRDRIYQVLDNLVVNAIKYGSGAAQPRIEIGGRIENDEIRVFVKDNGVGIAPEFHKKVFELFHRLDQDTEGAGVGLAIVKRIVEGHGGRAWVESRPGEGAGFWLAFPVGGGFRSNEASVGEVA